MFDKDTPPGTQVICIKDGPILKGWEDQPRVTVGTLYTVKQTFVAHLSKGVGFHLEEVGVFKKKIDGEEYQIGYDSEWFRPLDKYVEALEAEGNHVKDSFSGMPSPDSIRQFEEMKKFLKAVKKLKRREGE